jgi:hypothetical protein
MSNSLARRLCLQAGVILASAWLVNTGYSQQSGGGISSLGITDDGTARFTWEANSEPDLAGYRLYVGTLPGLYSGYVDVGKVTAYELTELLRGMRYYFALTAYNTTGLESGFTPDLTWQVPLVASGGVVIRGRRRRHAPTAPGSRRNRQFRGPGKLAADNLVDYTSVDSQKPSLRTNPIHDWRSGIAGVRAAGNR